MGRLVLLILVACSPTATIGTAAARATRAHSRDGSSTLTARGSPWLAAADLARYHLMPAPPIVRSTCAKMAARASLQGIRLAVFCPPVVPDVVPIRRELAGGILRYRSYADGYNAAFWSPHAHWAYNWGGHWTFAAGAAESLRDYVDPPGAPIHAVTRRHMRIAGVGVTLYAMSPTAPAFYAGHLVMAWRQAGKTFNLSVHGLRWEARLSVMAGALIREARTCSGAGQRPAACEVGVYR